MTGFEFFQMVACGLARPTIFVSSSADVAVSVSAMKARAVDFLTKPVDNIPAQPFSTSHSATSLPSIARRAKCRLWRGEGREEQE
jgi:FixJ family two-component response regulator